MSGTLNMSPNPQLSPGFARAQTVSRILATLLGIGFWFTLVVAVILVALTIFMLIWPLFGTLPAGTLSYNSPAIPISSLSVADKLGVGLAFLLQFGPSIAALFFGRRVFRRLAKGEVFSTATIADMRSASLWMVVVAFALSIGKLVFDIAVGINADGSALHPVGGGLRVHGVTFSPALLFFGLCAYVITYVMVEARSIADDNASIV